ncbi:MAG: L-serine ammonia-lyase [Lasallia pustulata]|uniref:L-serine ammonia-lyase n=1 Tax=Lasallia pustulata TaxID=136370 RepID=A0A5M8Q022_9LECA|nr:MAG: L-serine ammonia-lyase [Lasallia pustulata]
MPDPNLKRPWISTPLIESAALSKAAGCRIFLKLENLQPAGSFKSRGIGNLVLQAAHRSPHRSHLHFYSSSGGNAGLACTTAARSLSLPATIVVPDSTPAFMIAKLRAAGATAVLQQGASWAEADAYLRKQVLAGREDAVYVPPFDHADIWEGVGGMVEEIREQLEGGRPDALPDDPNAKPADRAMWYRPGPSPPPEFVMSKKGWAE